MSRFYDPVPVIERALPLTRGSALAGAIGGQSVPVKWQGKTVTALTMGIPLAEMNNVSIVSVDGHVFALANSGGYPSTEPKKLSSWANRAPASLAIRKIMEGNPRHRLYQLAGIAAWDSENETATLVSGETLPVRFGAESRIYGGSVTAGSLGLVYNGDHRHVIGGAFVYGEVSVFGWNTKYADFLSMGYPAWPWPSFFQPFYVTETFAIWNIISPDSPPRYIYSLDPATKSATVAVGPIDYVTGGSQYFPVYSASGSPLAVLPPGRYCIGFGGSGDAMPFNDGSLPDGWQSYYLIPGGFGQWLVGGAYIV